MAVIGVGGQVIKDTNRIAGSRYPGYTGTGAPTNNVTLVDNAVNGSIYTDAATLAVYEATLVGPGAITWTKISTVN